MRRSWLSRLGAVLLIAGMFGGGSGAPVLDALLYHRDARHPDHPVTHLEPKGTRHTHSDECTLGWLLRVQPSASAAPCPAPVAVGVSLSNPVHPAPAPRESALLSLPHSRAPPARNA